MKKYLILIGTTVIVIGVIYFYQRNEEMVKSAKVHEAVHLMDEGNYEQAFSILKPLADKGYAGAQIWLAQFYIHGRIVKQDDDEAIRLFKLANIVDANCKKLQEPAAGWVYAVGRDFERDGQQEKAQHWYRLAKDLGYDATICPVSK